jgi:hypothetical protein
MSKREDDRAVRPEKDRAVDKETGGRREVPDPASVVSEETMVSPSGKTYRIRHTRETDPYDPPEESGEESKQNG